MKKTYLSHCIAALTATASLTSVNLYAQEQDAALEEVVVTGIRSSILNSVAVKRDADTIVEVVDAGDLSSLPDASIADSLGRLPGVTTVRDSGQSSQLNIRGMNGDFIQTTLNGREQATTSSETESLRWMAFDQYPAELITQAAVYKSPKASLVEGGVAATVELKTANPLDAAQDHNFNVKARLSYNDAAEDVGADANGNRLSASYMGKFLDETLGVSLGFSHLDQPNSFTKARASADDQLGYGTDDPDPENGIYRLPAALQFQAGSGKDIRDSYMAAVVWEPSDNLSLSVDYFATKFESEDIRHGVTVGSLGGGGATLTPLSVNSAGEIEDFAVAITDPHIQRKGGTWIESRTEDQSSNADSTAIGVNLEWVIREGSTLSLDFADSSGEKTRKDRLATMHAYEPYTTGDARWSELASQGFTYESNGDDIPTLELTGDIDLTSLDQMKLGRYEEYPHLYTDDVQSFKVDFVQEVELGFVNSIETGVRLSERVFDSERGAFLWGSRDGIFNIGDGETESWCDDNLSDPFVECSPIALDGFASVGSVEGAPDHLVVSIDGLADEIFGAGNYEGKQIWARDWTFVESGALVEDTKAFYILANIETQLGDIPVTGNFGVRHVKTDVKAQGLVYVGNDAGDTIVDDVGNSNSNFVEGEFGPEFSDTLPSLNLNFELTDSDYVRLAAAKVLGRPPVGQMKGGAGGWFDTTTVDQDGVPTEVPRYNVWTKGTPYLDPFRATQLDVSYEHYFEDDGAVTVAGFYKKIDTLVQQRNYAPGEIDFIDYGITIPDSAPEDTVEGAFNTFENSEGGYIRGIELAGTKTFTSLPGVFGGLGLTASYSYTESETEVGGGALSGETVSLPGLSENVWSATAFWDIDNFSTHLNVRSRDEYVVNLAIPGSSTPVLAKPYTTVDIQASYAFDMGLEVVLQANNLTDEPNKQDYGSSSLLGEYSSYGRQFYVGVNYAF
ncbi:TonB-dependent receptor [Saccharophagus degradans]|uniref:TonB-dependent receptor n=1 Tax=Saccharophagus degradans (strain 2-40 / ATCC 43961 / DSM 17024) TaxID=203122 RepID=Q21N78_SACD2|nr:TonB-dependent receptor [Saccharophagus degradans]ABD79851.1 TonB-dependent receptor [Saccharophagus degradans 2-40]